MTEDSQMAQRAGSLNVHAASFVPQVTLHAMHTMNRALATSAVESYFRRLCILFCFCAATDIAQFVRHGILLQSLWRELTRVRVQTRALIAPPAQASTSGSSTTSTALEKRLPKLHTARSSLYKSLDQGGATTELHLMYRHF